MIYHLTMPPGVSPSTPDPASDPVLADLSDAGVLELRLNRPTRRNAIDTAMVLALTECLQDAGARVVLLGSSDPAGFCAGADLNISDAERVEVSDLLYELYRRMIELPSPIIAVLQGAAVGGGAQIAVAADLRVADATASVRFVGPGHGLAVGAWALGSLVGRGRALDLCLIMRTVAADEALAIGLIDRVESDPWLAARAMASDMAGLDRTAVARVKRIVHDGAELWAMLEQERAGNRAAWGGAVAPPRDPARGE
jgi:enoyl-CoA hydratase/carnithine racemase